MWHSILHYGKRVHLMDGIQSIERAFAILKSFAAAENRGVRLADIVDAVGLTKSMLLPPKERAGQVVRMAQMNCLGDLYPRARWGWTSL